MADKMPICYPFPGASEENGYRLFPDHLENDEFVAFHGTAEANLSSIIDSGFIFAGSLQSLSFAKSSALALGYACQCPDSGITQWVCAGRPLWSPVQARHSGRNIGHPRLQAR